MKLMKMLVLFLVVSATILVQSCTTIKNNVIKEEKIVKIINSGILAPSGDNCQPWQVFFHEGRLYLKNIEIKDTLHFISYSKTVSR